MNRDDFPDMKTMLDTVDIIQHWADFLKNTGNETADFWVCTAAPLVNSAAASLRGAAALLHESIARG